MSFSSHKKKFPPEIGEYFDSTWKKRELWELDLPNKAMRVSALQWHLDYPFWSREPPGPVFNLRPRVVLSNPSKHLRHWNRIVTADLSYPLEVGRFGERHVILDGLHRLAKVVLAGANELQCKLVPGHYIRKFAEVDAVIDCRVDPVVRLGATDR